jgi:hypothetical protein
MAKEKVGSEVARESLCSYGISLASRDRIFVDSTSV